MGKSNLATEVLGQQRPMCCTGCKAVCEAIVASGNEDYYRYRETGTAQNTDLVPDFLDNIELYDQPELQRECVRDIGHLKQITLLLEDIRCAACLWLNERHLRQQAGISSVDIDRVANLAHIQWDPDRLQLSDILRTIAAIGYRAHPIDPSHRQTLDRDSQYRSTERLIFAGILGMVIMQFSLAGYLVGPGEYAEQPLWIRIGRWSSLIVSMALLVWPGREFFDSAWRSLRHRQLGMDLPIALGLSIAWLASLWSTWRGTGPVYFDSIAMFVFLVLLARRLELRGRRLAAGSRDHISRVIPRTAERLLADGTTETVSISHLAPDDRILVAPGESLPTDAVLEQSSELDESALTGESRPVHRRAGSAAPAGALNVGAPLRARITASAEDSAAEWVSRRSDEAARWRPAYVRSAERVVPYFIATVLGLGSLTLLLWSLHSDFETALGHAIAVLIVTCPCALALASPTAGALAVGHAVQNGLIPRTATALERLAGIDTVVFDKTGTLTEGRPALLRSQAFDGDPDQINRIAGRLAAQSPHPLSRALRAALPDGSGTLAPKRVHLHTGLGVSALIDQQEWRLGRADFVLDGATASRAANRWLARVEAAGLQIVTVGPTGQIKAAYALRDSLRKEAFQTVAQLRASGISDFHILSGDSETAVSQSAELLNIDHWCARQSPHDKLDYLRRLQADGKTVLMVGDGLNDLPVLQGADLSMALGDATELARYHSDWVLLGKRLNALTVAQTLAIRTRRVIRQNLYWAIGYNAIAVPFAVAGMIPPWAAALGMSASSIVVVLNSLRLRGRQKEGQKAPSPRSVNEHAAKPGLARLDANQGL